MARDVLEGGGKGGGAERGTPVACILPFSAHRSLREDITPCRVLMNFLQVLLGHRLGESAAMRVRRLP